MRLNGHFYRISVHFLCDVDLSDCFILFCVSVAILVLATLVRWTCVTFLAAENNNINYESS